MAEGGSQRRLAAIVAIDVAGYSRLMGADEQGTLDALKGHRDAMRPLVQQHEGRLVGTAGDGLLLEFPSVVEAVTCAIEVQAAMAERNADIPEEQKMLYRIGINLGDVLVEGDDIFGDGVNVAARIEALAEPGGICLSRTVRDNVRDRMAIGLEDMGDVEVKNIARPVRTFRVVLDQIKSTAQPARSGRVPRMALVSAAVVVLLAVVAGVLVWLAPWRPAFNPALALPEKPSIAVLPFANLSDDPAQEYFADGMTEDLITDLSKLSGLFVIARNSVFTYKGKAVKVRQVAEELGVRYVLEGSVRRAGDKVRINAQLIDATTGGHLWADRFDGSLSDVFALQDRTTAKIVAALAVRLTAKEAAPKSAGETASPEAHDAFLQGWSHFRRHTPEDYAKALPWFDKAVVIDPNYGRAWAALASLFEETSQRAWASSLGLSGSDVERRLEASLEEALKRPTPLAHEVKAEILALRTEQFDAAVAEAERAIALDPNRPDSYVILSRPVAMLGRVDEAIRLVEKAMRLDPHYPAIYLFTLGFHYFRKADYAKAIEMLERARARNPEDWLQLAWLAAAYAHAGRLDEARAAAAELQQKWPSSGYVPFAAAPVSLAFIRPRISQVSRAFRDGLLKAGVPELPDSISVRPADRVPAAELRELLSGARITGDSGGSRWQIERYRNGSAQHFRNGQPTYMSKSAIHDEDSAVCYSPKETLFRSNYCCQWYRNGDGSKDALNEYIAVCSIGVYPLARFELSSN